MKTNKLLCALCGFLFLVSVLLQVVDSCCFARSFYVSEYAKNGTAASIGMSEEGLMRTTDALLDYLKDRRDDLIVYETVHGTEREIFDTREKLHMIDVKNLYRNAMRVKAAAFAAAAVLFAYMVLKRKDRPYAVLRDSFRRGGSLLGLFILFVLVWAVADFNGFWIQFHYILFDNELFFLDPNTEILINMVPETFFFDLVTRIILVFLAVMTACGACMLILKKREDRQ